MSGCLGKVGPNLRKYVGREAPMHFRSCKISKSPTKTQKLDGGDAKMVLEMCKKCVGATLSGGSCRLLPKSEPNLNKAAGDKRRTEV